MAVTYTYYDTSTPQGGTLAVSINHLRLGLDGLNRWYAAANVASDAGTQTGLLKSGDFGAATSADALLLWQQGATLFNSLVLPMSAASSIGLAIGSLDKGIPG